ncbi:MAG: energy transducer TonB [Candidatus Eisenbacteria bacterium]|uniref:Energy transducer TonB n=1 Tax=Eiseniibacteriota bacterium TaxID=2212470 RepID=A0A9D6QKN1_UNCEI|nr:energy transducer TonB [Candidatus Eisenbacteria bacterium]MBI3540440.1 energy transducer TonB [Candidatus Eisenbacteria bacterium]
MLPALLTMVTLAAPALGAHVPGTKLRLGMSENQAESAGTLVEAKAGETGATTRKGEIKFFGIRCDATLTFKGGVLTRARFEADAVSPHALGYVEDQLRRAHMWRECSRYEPETKVCDWMGEVKIHLEIKLSHLEAIAEAAAVAGGDAATAAADSAAHGEPARTGPAHAATPAMAPAPAAAAPAAVATLPETLTISLVTKNSPSDWPRIVASPPLEYPDAAKKESVQGVVWVLALVGADGAAESARVDRGITELNAAAVSWIQRAKFAPCVKDGKPCRFWVRVAVRFTLY